MKKFLRKHLPDQHTIKKHKWLSIFGDRLTNPSLWHINRHNVAKGVGVGLFVAFLPVPFQMVIAVALALLASANIALSVALVWISNPITIPFIFYGCYTIGQWIVPPKTDIIFQANTQWISDNFSAIASPFLLGCALAATLMSIAGYVVTHLLWQAHTRTTWLQRKKRNKMANL
jgi:uncharacterized protein (DUF2062 family)